MFGTLGRVEASPVDRGGKLSPHSAPYTHLHRTELSWQYFQPSPKLR